MSKDKRARKNILTLVEAIKHNTVMVGRLSERTLKIQRSRLDDLKLLNQAADNMEQITMLLTNTIERVGELETRINMAEDAGRI